MTLAPSTTQEVASKPKLRGWLHVGAFFAYVVLGAIVIAKAHGVGQRAAMAIYALTMLALFGVSALYHRGRFSARVTRGLRRADHLTIFCAIAGTYSAVSAVALGGWAQVTVLCLVWGGSAVGIVIRQRYLDAPKWLVSLPYLVVGWSALVVIVPLESGLGPWRFTVLMLGGACYSLGAAVYARRRPDPNPAVFGFHEIFHACTVAGALLQYVVIVSKL